MTDAHILLAVVLLALTAYALGAGADFGGGVWDLLARGPRAARQRALIAHAIGPIWEANHVWIILVVVLLFVCFPPAFAAISTALHVPLTLMLVGIVLRGSAFTFRSYDAPDDAVQRRWGLVFAVASLVSPVMLGVCVGTLATGSFRAENGEVTDFWAWLAPFPFLVGFLTLALFAFLAAVYLTLETRDAELQDDFRSRALAAGVATGVLALSGLPLARAAAPMMWDGLLGRTWSLPFQAFTALVAVAALAALVRRSYAAARVLAMLQVALVIWGWGFSQYPYLVIPDLPLSEAAAPPRVLRAVLVALAGGALLLGPALAYLFHVFKAGPQPAGEARP